MKINVLNEGFVRLVEHVGSDLSIVRSARVSYDADWRTGEDAGKDEKLIRYLLKNHHTSPFESVVFTFEIKCPMFIARQWHRHRTWSYNEVSARYTKLDEGFYIPTEESVGRQAKHNKQMRVIEENSEESAEIVDLIARSLVDSNSTYLKLIDLGCPRELARSVLPTAAYTRFFGTVNLHNLFHFIRLRIHEHAQYEIRGYAKALLNLIEPHVPVAVEAFKEFQLS